MNGRWDQSLQGASLGLQGSERNSEEEHSTSQRQTLKIREGVSHPSPASSLKASVALFVKCCFQSATGNIEILCAVCLSEGWCVSTRLLTSPAIVRRWVGRHKINFWNCHLLRLRAQADKESCFGHIECKVPMVHVDRMERQQVLEIEVDGVGLASPLSP